MVGEIFDGSQTGGDQKLPGKEFLEVNYEVIPVDAEFRAGVEHNPIIAFVAKQFKEDGVEVADIVNGLPPEYVEAFYIVAKNGDEIVSAGLVARHDEWGPKQLKNTVMLYHFAVAEGLDYEQGVRDVLGRMCEEVRNTNPNAQPLIVVDQNEREADAGLGQMVSDTINEYFKEHGNYDSRVDAALESKGILVALKANGQVVDVQLFTRDGNQTKVEHFNADDGLVVSGESELPNMVKRPLPDEVPVNVFDGSLEDLKYNLGTLGFMGRLQPGEMSVRFATVVHI